MHNNGQAFKVEDELVPYLWKHIHQWLLHVP